MKILRFFGCFLGIINSMILIYESISGIIISSSHDSLNIFDSILLPFLVILAVFLSLILIKTLQNNFPKYIKVFWIISIVLLFILGLLLIWLAIVKTDENLFNALTGSFSIISAILLLFKEHKKRT